MHGISKSAGGKSACQDSLHEVLIAVLMKIQVFLECHGLSTGKQLRNIGKVVLSSSSESGSPKRLVGLYTQRNSVRSQRLHCRKSVRYIPCCNTIATVQVSDTCKTLCPCYSILIHRRSLHGATSTEASPEQAAEVPCQFT